MEDVDVVISVTIMIMANGVVGWACVFPWLCVIWCECIFFAFRLLLLLYSNLIV